MLKKRRIHLKYRADTFENVFSVFPVPENPMVATKMFALSAIGAKLANPTTTNSRHLGFLPKSRNAQGCQAGTGRNLHSEAFESANRQ